MVNKLIDSICKEVGEAETARKKYRPLPPEVEANLYLKFRVYSRLFVTGTFTEMKNQLNRYICSKVIADILHEND